MGTEKNSEFYDDIYASSKVYSKKWDEIPMYDIAWGTSIDILQENNKNSLLDIGCGCGHFGEACKKFNLDYKGIDFSKVAISKCKEKLPEFEFECVNVFDYHYEDEVDAYVSHEFLEHVEEDLSVIKQLSSGKLFIFSVPNFDTTNHVRWFTSEEEVKDRYSCFFKENASGNNLDIKKITLETPENATSGLTVIYLAYGTLL